MASKTTTNKTVNTNTTKANKRGEKEMKKTTNTKTTASKNTTEVKRGAKTMEKKTATNKTASKNITLKLVVTSVYNSRGKLVPAVLNVPYVDADSFQILADKAHTLYGRCTKKKGEQKREWHFRQGHADDAVAFKVFVEKNISKLTVVKEPKRATKRIKAEVVESVPTPEVETLSERVDKLEKSVDKRFASIEKGIKAMCGQMQDMMNLLNAPKPVKRVASKSSAK